jgi:hypothetical protein
MLFGIPLHGGITYEMVLAMLGAIGVGAATCREPTSEFFADLGGYGNPPPFAKLRVIDSIHNHALF